MSIQTEFDSWTKKENEMTHLSTVRHSQSGTEPYVQGKSFIKLEISFSN